MKRDLHARKERTNEERCTDCLSYFSLGQRGGGGKAREGRHGPQVDILKSQLIYLFDSKWSSEQTVEKFCLPVEDFALSLFTYRILTSLSHFNTLLVPYVLTLLFTVSARLCSFPTCLPYICFTFALYYFTRAVRTYFTLYSQWKTLLFPYFLTVYLIYSHTLLLYSCLTYLLYSLLSAEDFALFLRPYSIPYSRTLQLLYSCLTNLLYSLLSAKDFALSLRPYLTIALNFFTRSSRTDCMALVSTASATLCSFRASLPYPRTLLFY